MNKQLTALAFACIASLTACGGGGGGGSSTPSMGGGGGTPTPPPSGVGAQTIGMARPNGNIGMVNTSPYGLVGGYTQSVYSQVLAFAPGTTITLKNLSPTNPHTLNVLSTTGFPAGQPSLNASGGNSLTTGFASGTLGPGATMSVTLSTPGTYYIGCAYDYVAFSMRDVILVSAGASPGPQATPQPSSGGGGGCTGYYC